MVKLNNPNVIVTIERQGRVITGYVDTEPGKCFDDGTHCRTLTFHTGTKRDVRKALAEFVERDWIVECDDPECDICHPIDEDE